MIVNSIAVALPCLTSFILLFQLQGGQDPFFVVKELNLLSLFIILMIIIQSILTLTIHNRDVIRMCDCIIMTTGLFIFCLIQTAYVLLVGDKANPLRRLSMKNAIESRLISYLNSQHGFAGFENYLKEEFSQINLNFFVEVCQYKKIVTEALGLTSKELESDAHEKRFDELNFKWFGQPEDFSQFFAKMYAMHLHEKYITSTSISQVNLPYQLASNMEKNIVDSESIQLPDVFDEVLEETVLLMLDSFRRFTKTKGYKELDFDIKKSVNSNVFGVVKKKPQKLHFLSSKRSISDDGSDPNKLLFKNIKKKHVKQRVTC